MNRQQVQQALGSPLLQDVFNSSRWDYVYRTLSGRGALEQRVLTVFFDANNTVSRWVGQEAPNQNPLNTSANTTAAAPVASPTTPNTPNSVSTVPSAPLQRDVAALGANTAVIDLAVAPSLPIPVAAIEPAPVASAASSPAPAMVARAAPALASQAAPVADSITMEIQARIESWRSAWEAKDLNRYAAHYANDYKGELANSAAWLAQRKRVMDDAGAIVLQVSNLNIIQTANDEVRVSFTQSYQSRRLTEMGEKSLFFKRIGNEWKIITERFIKQ
jgi:hypothetical protein